MSPQSPPSTVVNLSPGSFSCEVGEEFVVNFHEIPKVVILLSLPRFLRLSLAASSSATFVYPLDFKTVPSSKIPIRCNVDKNPYVRYVLVPSEQRHCNRWCKLEICLKQQVQEKSQVFYVSTIQPSDINVSHPSLLWANGHFRQLYAVKLDSYIARRLFAFLWQIACIYFLTEHCININSAFSLLEQKEITDELKAHISWLSQNGSTLVQCTYSNTGCNEVSSLNMTKPVFTISSIGPEPSCLFKLMYWRKYI